VQLFSSIQVYPLLLIDHATRDQPLVCIHPASDINKRQCYTPQISKSRCSLSCVFNV
jgi:hypothetical protein